MFWAEEIQVSDGMDVVTLDSSLENLKRGILHVVLIECREFACALFFSSLQLFGSLSGVKVACLRTWIGVRGL